MDATRSHFEKLLGRIGASRSFREALAKAGLGLPGAILPFSLLDGALVARTLAVLQLPHKATLVDIGCGFGAGGIAVAQRAEARLIGVDVALAALTVAGESARELRVEARFVRALGERTGLPDASADGVVSFHAMMWMDPTATLTEIARILRPGARFVMTANEWTAEEDCELPTVVRRYAPFVPAAGLVLQEDETIPPGYDRAFYAAMERHATALREELGEAAAVLLEPPPPVRRTRDRWLVARKPVP